MNTIANIPNTQKERVIILGGGFAGLRLARKLSQKAFQVVLLDRNNFHVFQPLFYQVATSGLEPAAISFPLRKVFQKQTNVHIRVAEVQGVDPENRQVQTSIGYLDYDYLVMALGADTNYFGNENIRRHAIPMKSLNEAINLRNKILENYELALNETDRDRAASMMNFIIVGGGPTGVELAGALAEMKNFILPKDYPELDFSLMKVQLLEAGPTILAGYSEKSSNRAKAYLEKLGVEVRVKDQPKLAKRYSSYMYGKLIKNYQTFEKVQCLIELKELSIRSGSNEFEFAIINTYDKNITFDQVHFYGVFQGHKNKILEKVPLHINGITNLAPNEKKKFKAVFEAPKLNENEMVTFRVAIEFYNLLEGFQGNKVPVVMLNQNTNEE